MTRGSVDTPLATRLPGALRRPVTATTASSIDRCAKRGYVACHHEDAHDQRGKSMERNDQARLAVLIDADNTSAKWADAIFEEIATLGEASVRRIYGDFSGPQLRGWEKKLAGLAVTLL